jgi:hypothetical protein
MRALAHLRFVVAFQNEANNLLQELVAPGRHRERAFLRRMLFLDVDTSGRGPSVALISHGFNERVDFPQ